MFNIYTKDYIYYETKLNENSQKNRKELGREEKGLIKKLSYLIDKKRKLILHLVNIPSQSLQDLKNYLSKFPKLKITFKTEEDFN